MGSWLIITDNQVSYFNCYKNVGPTEMLLCEDYFRKLEFDKQFKYRENLVFLCVDVI